jgi:aryl-alcohol dehydrogenase-like predicted oxidoreductase
VDTAEVYGPHTNEQLLGKAFKTLNRQKLIIATKFGAYFDGLDSSPKKIRQAIEGSLERLGTKYVDLYYQHRPDPNTPIEETMQELKKLFDEGKVKYIGLSETSAENIRRAHAIHPISALQYEWSIWTRELEKEVVPVAKELGIGICSVQSFGKGIFAWSDFKARGSKTRRIGEGRIPDLQKNL